MRQQRSSSASARGTVILLVIAALALLVILGTAYIVSARVEKSTARSTTDAHNLNFAGDAALRSIQSLLLEGTIRPGDNKLFALGAAPWTPGKAYAVGDIVLSRLNNLYCCGTAHTSGFQPGQGGPPPELTATNWRPIWAWAPGVAYNAKDIVAAPGGQIYQCTNPHTSDLTNNGPPPKPNGKWQAIGGVLPLPLMTRDYDYPEDATVLNQATPLTPDQSWLCADFPWWASSTSYAPGQVVLYQGAAYLCTQASSGAVPSSSSRWRALPCNPFTQLAPYRFDPSTGRNSQSLPTTPEVAVIAPETTGTSSAERDGIWYLLPFSNASNVRYRVALRVIDTNSKLNLNTGQVWDVSYGSPIADSKGEYLTSTMLGAASVYQNGSDDNLLNLHASNGYVHGRGAAAGAFTLQGWQDRVLGYERGGFNPASMTATIAAAEWFDFSDELELRAYGYLGGAYRGAPYTPRCASEIASMPLLGDTLAPGTAAAPGSRRFYSAFTVDRNMGLPMAGGTNLQGINPKWTLTIAGNNPSAVNWPSDPAGNNRDYKLVPLKSATTNAAGVARNVVYLANLLSAAKYSDDEALAFAVNYAGQTAPEANTSYIGPNGLVVANNVPVGSYGVNAASPFAAAPALSKTYFAYSAQPFLNEVAIAIRSTVQSGANYLDFAVELINPYAAGTAINLSSWRLKINGTVWISDLGTLLYSGNSNKMPGQSLGVVLHATGSWFSGGVTGTKATQPVPVDPTVGTYYVTLERPYHDGTALRYMVVDKIQVSGVPAPNSVPKEWSVQRANVGAAGTAHAGQSPTTATQWWWECVAPVNAPSGTTVLPTLGKANAGTGSTTSVGLPLPDRFMTATPPAADAKIVRDGKNVGDLMDYMRLCTIYDPSKTGDAQWTTITEQLADTTKTWTGNTVGLTSQFPQEAKLRFEYIVDPRAQRVLRLLAQIDRASDGADQLAAGTADTVDENRIHGRINVNTASADVLRAIRPLDALGATQRDKLVAYLLAYRDRLPAGTYYGVSCPDFSTYAGRGIRTLGELIIPLSIADGTLSTSLTPVSNAMLADIGGVNATWAKLLASCTVRSDTFVVYGYLEALRAGYGHNNGSDWYPSNPPVATDISDDPKSTSAKNIRLAKRRFVALVDRSWCNAPHDAATFVMPRIVAVRDLPP